MRYINVLTTGEYPYFIQQFDSFRFAKEYTFFENSDADIAWDLVIVYGGCKKEISLNHKIGGLVFMTGEPPMVYVYPYGFIRQFDTLSTFHPRMKHPNHLRMQHALNWHFGLDWEKEKYRYTFEELLNFPLPEKVKNISIITSAHKNIPGHILRLELVERLRQEFQDEIDFYGKGVNPVRDKAEALLPYRFHICLENSAIPHYWTEKFADPILGYSIPIYAGCPNIKEYFPEDFYYTIDLNKPDDAVRLIRSILSDPRKYYEEKIEKLLHARMMLLNTYNFFPMVISQFNKQLHSGSAYRKTVLRPATSYFSYPFLCYRLNLQKKILRICLNSTKPSVKSFFSGCFSVLMRKTASYLMN